MIYKGGDNTMKKLPLLVVFIGMMLIVVSASHAEDEPYVSLNAGYLIANNAEVKTGDTVAGRLEYQDGYLVSGSLGRWLGDQWRVESEFQYQRNKIDSATGIVTGTDENGHTEIMLLMGNVYYDFNNRTRFTPFLTGGLGYAWLEANNFTFPLGDTKARSYAFRIGTGLAYQLDERLLIDFKYQYLTLSDPDFSTVETEFRSHNFSMGVRFCF